jgi:hypothetical protein
MQPTALGANVTNLGAPANGARRSGRKHAQETVLAAAQETVLTTAQETVLTTASRDRALASRSTFPITW